MSVHKDLKRRHSIAMTVILLISVGGMRGRVAEYYEGGNARWSHHHVGMQMLLLLISSVESRESVSFLSRNPAIKNVLYSFHTRVIHLAAIFRRKLKHPTALQVGGRGPRVQALGHETCQKFPGTILRARRDLAWKPKTYPEAEARYSSAVPEVL